MSELFDFACALVRAQAENVQREKDLRQARETIDRISKENREFRQEKP